MAERGEIPAFPTERRFPGRKRGTLPRFPSRAGGTQQRLGRGRGEASLSPSNTTTKTQAAVKDTKANTVRRQRK